MPVEEAAAAISAKLTIMSGVTKDKKYFGFIISMTKLLDLKKRNRF